MEARIHVIDYHKQPACSQGLLQRMTEHKAVCTPDRKRDAKKATRKLSHKARRKRFLSQTLARIPKIRTDIPKLRTRIP
jgi:hypothetical protein